MTERLIVTAVPDGACTLPQGNKQTLMGILNKQDYARWHSYQFYCSVGDADATIRPEGALDVSTFNSLASPGLLSALAQAPWYQELQMLCPLISGRGLALRDVTRLSFPYPNARCSWAFSQKPDRPSCAGCS